MLFTLNIFTRLNSFVVSFSSFVCVVHHFRLPLVCALHWSKVRILIPEVRFLPFNFHIGFRFLMPLVSFRCWSKTLFHWLSIVVSPLLPLPLLSPLPLFLLLPYHSSPPTWFTHKVDFLIFKIFFFCIFFIYYVIYFKIYII